jgi:tripartite-type tricarboxylate transporter receptor subunit TctC
MIACFVPRQLGWNAMKLLPTAVMLGLTIIGVAAAPAQTWPTKPIRIIVPTAPGGTIDIMARSLAQKFTESTGQRAIVDNRPGANGIIGVELAAKATADGYTLLAGTNGQLVMNPAVFTTLPFNTVRDFAPVSIVVASPFILCVHPSLPAKNVQEFIAYVKSRPGQIPFSSFGPASVAQFAMELFMLNTGTKMTHVPYKGGGPSGAALVAGEVMATFDAMQNQMPFIKDNRVRALAIAAPARSRAMPDLPTLTEAGVGGADVGGWYALLAPAGTPRPVVNRIYEEVVKASKAPELRERFESTGSELVINTPDHFAVQIKSEIAQWTRVAREAHIKAD